MTKEEDFELLVIQNYVLRVNIHCDGCKHRVRKLLGRIEGVLKVVIGSEQQRVTVTVLGSVDSDTLINKLVGAGKHAQLWSDHQKSTLNQKKENSTTKDDKSKQKKNQVNDQLVPFDEDDEDDDLDDEDLTLLRNKVNGFLKKGHVKCGSHNHGKIKAPQQQQPPRHHTVTNANANANATIFPSGFRFHGPQEQQQPNIGQLGQLNANQQSQMIDMMNLQQQQQEMMYPRSPFVGPNTGYYSNNNTSPYNYYPTPSPQFHPDHTTTTGGVCPIM